ncbi:efflux transporter, RND family, MFP subunit [Verrucomicrobiia bacterium DG1235]|nr:efflux transporter, RND family, MFP subunit [Verrucomicrobiae bacterium DG1235]
MKTIYTAILATLLTASTIASEPIILSDSAVENLRIETTEAIPQNFTESLFAIGRIDPIPARKSILSSRIPGQVVTVSAHEGDQVAKDQILVEIESLQPGNPPPRIPLKAPLPGLVMQSHTHLGKPVTPDTELFEIIDLSQVYAVASLPEDQAGKTHLGTLANIKVAAFPNQAFTGELIRYGTEANPANGTIDAYFLLENEASRLRPNMRTEFSIVLDSKANTMSVPKDSVQTDGINTFVFVEDFDLKNAFVKVPVLAGSRNSTHVEILKGLFPGDRIVTRGSYALMFAGSGTVSLKEALDAAHGHEHNEDGSELTAAQKQEQAAANSNSPANGFSQSSLVWFLSILSSLLAVLLVLSLATRRKA